MAGKELYIEPILDANLSVVPELSENIAEMTAQLNETTRIMMNMLSNQGLELHQEAYNGSAFSALTVKNNTYSFTKDNPAVLTMDTGNTACRPDEVSHDISVGSGGTRNLQCYFRPVYLDDEVYTTPEKFIFRYGSDQVLTKVSVTAKFWFSSGSIELTEESNLSIGTLEFTMPEEKIGEPLPAVNFTITVTASPYTDKRFIVQTPVLRNTGESDITVVNKRVKTLSFNGANAFTFYAPPASGVVTADISSKIIPQTAFITLPDIVSVGTWATFLTNGSIDGVSLALVDNTSHDILITLPAATSDITPLVQTNNLALSVSMASQTQVINSIAQRYY